jgi:hypothetical protein
LVSRKPIQRGSYCAFRCFGNTGYRFAVTLAALTESISTAARACAAARAESTVKTASSLERRARRVDS